MQYATEKEADTVEVRIYTGANGQFTLYEDENDNYNYEKGKHSEITLTYNDTLKHLTIGNRTGSYDNLPHPKTFNIEWVRPGFGCGINAPAKCDTTIHYSGSQLIIPFSQNGVAEVKETPVNSSFCSVYPNPAHDTINVVVNAVAASVAQINIYTLSGVSVYQSKEHVTTGKNRLMISAKEHNIAKGIYLISVHLGINEFNQTINIF